MMDELRHWYRTISQPGREIVVVVVVTGEETCHHT